MDSRQHCPPRSGAKTKQRKPASAWINTDGHGKELHRRERSNEAEEQANTSARELEAPAHKKQNAGLKSPAYSQATRHSPFTGLLPELLLRL
jgi:hypothetical protein